LTVLASVQFSAFGPDARPSFPPLTNVACGLGLKVLAEGVATKLQWDCLCQLGCDAMQGLYFGRPVSAERCWELLAPI
jgi:EAL domain-containing protein (putative c-di-GMP-specific phosphodiesterase class I)